jgi:hypothetical protein
MRVPSTTPPTSPAAAVATPAMTVFAEPLPFELLRLLELLLRLFELLRLPELLEALGLLRELADDLLRELADGLLRELADLLLELPVLLRELAALLFDALPLREDEPFGLDPFELFDEDDFRLVEERVFPWAIYSSLSLDFPALSNSLTPFGAGETLWEPAFSSGDSPR